MAYKQLLTSINWQNIFLCSHLNGFKYSFQTLTI